ncbi:MAG: hypothetical protein ACOYXM_16135 [Actinomycetota bacterium]
MVLRRCVAIALILTACSGGGDDDALRPADEVNEEAERQAAIAGEIGEPADLGGGVSVLVSSIEYHDDVEDNGTDDDYRIAVQVRAENRGDEDSTVPDANVGCSNTDETSGWYVDSTFELSSELPPDTFEEGELILGVPAGCQDPVVRFEALGIVIGDDALPAVDYAVPRVAQHP